jgi:hypothetical protein
MRLTTRCKDLLRLLRAARWLSTGQVRRRFFPHATVSAARRRLRRLAATGYVTKHQENRMREAIFTLGREARRVLETGIDGGKPLALERVLPKQLEHLAGINDIRIAAELSGQLSYFFAAWELPGVGWKHLIVPDAIFRAAEQTFAVEYDRGGEGLRYFVGSKVACYRRGLPGFPLAAVLVVADRDTRLEALARAIADGRDQFMFSTIGAIRDRGMFAPIWRRVPGGAAGPLIGTCSAEVSWRGNGFIAISDGSSTDYEGFATAS